MKESSGERHSPLWRLTPSRSFYIWDDRMNDGKGLGQEQMNLFSIR